MSRAGKFIPGGSGRSKSGGLPKSSVNAIRGPEDPARAGTPSSPERKLFPKGGLRQPVARKNRLPITLMSAVGLALLVWFAQYELITRPAQQRALQAEAEQAKAQQALAAARAADAAKAAAAAQLAAEKISVKVDTNPTGAGVTLGGRQKTTPATFTGMSPGTLDLSIHLDGYRDYQQKITAPAGQPLDLGTIPLAQSTGSIALSAPQDGVAYTLTGPNDYSHQGGVPDKLTGLPVGVYQLSTQIDDWKLPNETLTLHPDENLQETVKIPYAALDLQSVPPGATVRNGRQVLGQTPLSLANQRPGTLHLSVDLPPYSLQRVDIDLPASGHVSNTVTLAHDRDFVGAGGVDMVWIPAGGFWVEKYLMRQAVFETVAKYNPSSFRRPNRPVENISWDNAVSFCNKLNEYEAAAGKLPAGYHYSLPTESQWALFSADADLDQAATSRTGSLSSTQDVGYSEPNKYGLYDTLGNVWEWCLDNYDDKGDHSLRGGNWLSSTADFPDAETRNGAPAAYSDRFTGFRVVLVPTGG